MDMEHETEALAASFDLVSRQDEAEKAITVLRSDVDEVKARLDRVSRAASRPLLTGTLDAVRNEAEVKGFVDGYLRHGRTTELKSIQGTVPSDGGYAVPREIDALIANAIKEISPIRNLAQVVQVGTSGYRKLVTTGGTASGWVAETTARPETASPKFAEVAPPSGDLYANPAASQIMLDDAAFDLEGWLASEIAMEFARAEGAAFVNGTGVNRPLGFLASPVSTVGDATRPFGTVQYVGSGNATGFGATPDSKLIDLIHTMKSGHRQGATWVMNSATLAVVRKLKTTDGAFLWQPGLVEGQPDRLFGYDLDPARSVHQQAVRALLRHQAGRRTGARQRGDQAPQDRGVS
jgi:HK97 family phage major capsid protein